MKDCMEIYFGVCNLRVLLNAALMAEDPWEKDSLLGIMESVLSQVEKNVSMLEEVRA